MLLLSLAVQVLVEVAQQQQTAATVVQLQTALAVLAAGMPQDHLRLATLDHLARQLVQ